ncbi:hypothetical protein [Pseudomarimonas salicorniae]|uniref:Uncharacterized protein n=1 Tax=Pseudomarimonas salicorniae TaxID=2933270 RepID=A0ABT0GC66_9GAMM|nr:hypothetical protein [Lysobacter sp. CAU 1642]MCK7592129.1 hypothetical protein [Lysobacter sp. CAU 1642]
MTARRLAPLAWLLLAACGLAGAQAGGAGALLLPEQPVLVNEGPLQRLIVRPLGEGRTPPADGRSNSFLTLEAGSGMSLLCDTSYGIGVALGDLDRHCLLAHLGDSGWKLGQVDQVSVGATLDLDELDLPFDIDFGLSWLQSDLDDGSDLEFGLIDPRYAPSAGIASDLAGESLHIGATHWISERSWVRVTGRGSRFRIDRLLPSGPLSWNTRSLRLDAGLGDFAGSLTGRETRIPRLDQSRFDLDVGVSWRTPWSGRFTVGARNLLSPADAMSPEIARGNEPLVEARTPYVRYQQDL